MENLGVFAGNLGESLNNPGVYLHYLGEIFIYLGIFLNEMGGIERAKGSGKSEKGYLSEIKMCSRVAVATERLWLRLNDANESSAIIFL